MFIYSFFIFFSFCFLLFFHSPVWLEFVWLLVEMVDWQQCEWEWYCLFTPPSMMKSCWRSSKAIDSKQWCSFIFFTFILFFFYSVLFVSVFCVPFNIAIWVNWLPKSPNEDPYITSPTTTTTKKNGTHDDLQTHMILDKHFRPSTNRTSGRSPHNRCLFWLEWCSQKCWYIYLPCMHGMSRIHNYIRKKHIETFYVHMVCCCCCFFPSTNHGYWCIANNSSNSITELCSCTCFWHSMSELVVTASCQLASQRKWSLKRTSIIMLFINRMAFFLFLLLHYT